ncbi:MAG: ferrous iron transport protein A [Candidatus Cloacimonadota bacterium]|nr:MAG: ferrous iron transport protein A [Candidatus Cloacimonadota bacterium]
MKEMDLTQVESNTKGIVAKILGGRRMMKKLETLGIRIGCELEKVSSHIMRGPVVVRVGNTRAAIGYGMAKKIIIEQEKNVE